MTSFHPESDFPKVHVHVIRDDKDIILMIDFIILYTLHNAFAREVHVGKWFKEQYFLPIIHPVTYYCLKLRFVPFLESPLLSNLIEHYEAEIMSSFFIGFTRISESYDKFHVFYILIFDWLSRDFLIKESREIDRRVRNVVQYLRFLFMRILSFFTHHLL